MLAISTTYYCFRERESARVHSGGSRELERELISLITSLSHTHTHPLESASKQVIFCVRVHACVWDLCQAFSSHPSWGHQQGEKQPGLSRSPILPTTHLHTHTGLETVTHKPYAAFDLKLDLGEVKVTWQHSNVNSVTSSFSNFKRV